MRRNMTWALLAAILTLLMPAGLALIATGLGRAKNAAHTMLGHSLGSAVALLSFFAIGFALAGANPSAASNAGWTVAHFRGFFLHGMQNDGAALCWFLISAASGVIALVIPLGAMSERLTLKAHLGLAIAIGGVLYPLAACWLWTGGWLNQLGTHLHLPHGSIDYAGAGAVHLLGGTIALVGAMIVRPRFGKFDLQGTPRPLLGHHVPMVILGTMIVAFAWMGFTTSRSFLGNDGQAPLVAVNTLLAGAGGALGAAGYMWLRFGRPDPSLTCNGLLAGLVSISAGCAYVAPSASLVIGVTGGVFAIAAVLFIEKRRVDDPVGASSVHGLAGVWGMLAVALFANGSGSVRGLLYGGGAGLLAVQVIAVVAIIVLATAGTVITFWLIERIVDSVRVSADIEFAGLDIPETGAPGYPEFVASQGADGLTDRSMP